MSNDPSHSNDTEPLLLSLLGAIPFDKVGLADALRTRALTKLEAAALANLIDDSHPDGIRLDLVGRGRNRPTWQEMADRYERCIAVGQMMDELRANGSNWEDAKNDTAEHFGISEQTVLRDQRAYRFFQSTEK